MNKEWIPMFNNDNYYVNPYTGKIKNKHGKILKGRSLIINNKCKCIYYNITYNGKVKSKKGHRIIAESVLNKSLEGIIVGHKNGANGDNRYINLVFQKKNNNGNSICVNEYKNGEFNKSYNSIREFERITGISHKCFKKRTYEIGIYRFEKNKNL